MKATEVRIGNYIKDDVLERCKVESIKSDKLTISIPNADIDGSKGIRYFTLNIDEFSPIPLTEEWLLKFGFEFNNYPDSLSLEVLSRGVLNAYDVSNNPKVEITTQSGILFGDTKIKYVHQLQNLYFALTNTELKIEL